MFPSDSLACLSLFTTSGYFVVSLIYVCILLYSTKSVDLSICSSKTEDSLVHEMFFFCLFVFSLINNMTVFVSEKSYTRCMHINTKLLAESSVQNQECVLFSPASAVADVLLSQTSCCEHYLYNKEGLINLFNVMFSNPSYQTFHLYLLYLTHVC